MPNRIGSPFSIERVDFYNRIVLNTQRDFKVRQARDVGPMDQKADLLRHRSVSLDHIRGNRLYHTVLVGLNNEFLPPGDTKFRKNTGEVMAHRDRRDA